MSSFGPTNIRCLIGFVIGCGLSAGTFLLELEGMWKICLMIAFPAVGATVGCVVGAVVGAAVGCVSELLLEPQLELRF